MHKSNLTDGSTIEIDINFPTVIIEIELKFNNRNITSTHNVL